MIELGKSIFRSEPSRTRAWPLPLVLALMLPGCELEGYGILRELADGSYDTTPDRDGAGESSGVEAATDSGARGETDTGPALEVPPDTQPEFPETESFDTETATYRDPEPETDAVGDTSEAVCMCECACATDEEQGNHTGAGTGATDAEDQPDFGTDESAIADTSPLADTNAETGAMDSEGPQTDDTGTVGTDEAACLIISEYIEGSSRNKGVELFNCGVETADLGTYSLCLVSNDNTECSTTLILEGVLFPGATLSICHTSADALPNCDILSGVANFSGDDRLILMREASPVDTFGDPEIRPEGAPWADTTLRRCNLTPFLGPVPFDVSAYYSTFPLDDFSDFGIAPAASGCAI
jgi:hypothetical protein